MIYYQAIDDSSLAAEFLNLDDETTPCTDQITTPELDPPSAPSSSPSSTATRDSLDWELESTSLQFLDMKKFETVTDLDSGEKTTPWPWGDYKYRPPTPLGYMDPIEYAMEYQLAEIERTLRDELMEIMTQQAIHEGRKATTQGQGGGGKGFAARDSDEPTTLAFNRQTVRGRTIYNP